jgi:hypothetical protein
MAAQAPGEQVLDRVLGERPIVEEADLGSQTTRCGEIDER